MSIPIISPITNIQSHKQWETWAFQPAATEHPVIWQSSPLPPGITLAAAPTAYHTSAAAAVAATDVLTATGSSFANGDKVFYYDLDGGVAPLGGLAVNTAYFVRDVSGASFKLAASVAGGAIDITADITSATIGKVHTGAIGGAATAAGTWDVTLYAANADGTSAPLTFPIGIAPAANSLRNGVDLRFDLQTGLVTVAGAALAEGQPLFAAKEGDDLILYVQAMRGETVVDLGTLASLKFALKELEPDQAVVLGGGDSGGTTPDIVVAKIGSGTSTTYVCVTKFDGSAIAAALANYEADGGTEFLGLGELELVQANAAVADYGPATLRRTSQTFLVKVIRDLVD